MFIFIKLFFSFKQLYLKFKEKMNFFQKVTIIEKLRLKKKWN